MKTALYHIVTADKAHEALEDAQAKAWHVNATDPELALMAEVLEALIGAAQREEDLVRAEMVERALGPTVIEP